MLHRRRFLALGLTGSAIAQISALTKSFGQTTQLAPAKPDEGLIEYIQRIRGQWDVETYKQLLGAANEFKEGDAIVGVAAASDDARRHARELIAATQVRDIDHHPPFSDELFDLICTALNRDVQRQIGDMTLGALKTFLLERSEADIHAIRTGLSSDVIACVVRLMNNAELIQTGPY